MADRDRGRRRCRAKFAMPWPILLFLFGFTAAAFHPEGYDPYYDNFILPQRSLDSSECYRYDENNTLVAQRCVPEFVNAAFGKHVDVTNTCGVREPTQYCTQVSILGGGKECYICDDRVKEHAHGSELLTDFNYDTSENVTWWQSETMNEGIQYPKTVNLTLWLGKAFDITYVRLKFVSPRPESFTIYKKTSFESEWTPWQFYSGSCKSTYHLPERAPVLPGNEAVAQCTREFSDISPLTGGNIAFSTLDGRPSAEIFEESEILQSWVTAVGIRIVLNRLNTFGDEVFRDSRVLKSYYYAISDLAVGGRCKCNGHANTCVMSTGETVERKLVCACQHNTAGADCEQCDSFHQDRPWRRGSADEANECLPCNCNNLSTRCYFDEKLYEETGHGGHCIDCAGNTQGPHCDECIADHYRRPGDNYCIPCRCNEKGSTSQQCDADGQCSCKPGVTGQYCDQCEAGFYEFSTAGCKDCHCEGSGSADNTPYCSSETGDCACKANVEGKRCDKCKPGYFELSVNNTFGCTPCFCFGHSSVCSAAEGYFQETLRANFYDDTDGWTAGSERKLEDVQHADVDKAIAISQMDDWPVYFHASEKLLGDLKAAYAQEIDFIMRTHLPTAAASNKDIIITGANGQELYSPITGKVNELPWMTEQFFFFTLHESHWSPKLTPIEFIAVLSNVTSIKIRGTYSKGDVGFLYTFKINTATTVPTSPEALPVTFVESCQCPEGHVGQFCESCAPGYRRERKFGGTMSKCVKCDCHGHSDSCDAESGACICQHNTAGETCESCARGYYGNALNGTENDCKACGCLGDGPCLEVPEGGTVCTDCPVGYTGLRCEQCAAEFYGNPAENRSCLPCPCNENIDMNAIGNCDSLTGQCLKCIYNTMGFNCEHCAVGFFGNATSEFRNECLPCQCYAAGTKSSKINAETGVIECNRESGQCDCKPHVTGHLCNECESGYFNITSGKGCQKCECFAMGSLENTCDITTGQCKCKPGVTGQKCDQCAPNHYGFGLEGCKPCECDGFGSENATCNVQTGQCPCKANVEGRRCDQCSENRFNIRAGCMQCDDCYTIIQSRKNDIVTKISELHSGLDYWENNKVEITDEGLLKIISEQVENIKDLKQDAFEWLDPTSTRAIKDFKTVGNKTIKALAKLRNLNSDYENLNVEIDDLEVQLKEFNKIKSEYQFQLNQDIQRLEDTGFTAANLAAEKLQLYGQNASQLDDLSREAEYYAKIETAAVDKLRNMIHEVDTKSMTAYVEAYDAVHNDRITPRIHLLREQTEELAKLWNETLASAEASVNESESVHDKAARALAKANAITVPIVDVDLMIKNLNESSHGVTESHKLYGKVNNIGGLLHQPVHSKLAKGKELLKEISRYKDEQDRNLKDLNDQLIRAEKAKKAVIDTVNQAEADIAALEEFNKNGPLFKPEFLEALEFVESIQNDTDFAVKLTSDIENMLGTAEADSIAALEISERFARQIDNAVQELEANEAAVAKINDDIAETKGIINKLIHDIEKVNDAMMSLEALEEVKQQHQAAARNASLAELQVKRAQKALDKSEEDLNSMTISLAASKPPSAEEIAELEKQLKKTSKLFRSKKSRRDLKKLRKTKLTALRDEVKAEYEALEAELEQLRQNFAELPDKCFNIVRLENSNEHF